MGKFWILFKKEVKELITLKMVLPLIIMTMVFAFVGQMISGEQEKIGEATAVGILNDDKGGDFNNFIKTQSESGLFVFNVYEGDLDSALENSRNAGDGAFLYVPENFTVNLGTDQKPDLEFYSFVDGFSLIAIMQSAKVDAVKAQLNDYFSNRLIAEKAQIADPSLLKQPYILTDVVVMNGNRAEVSFQNVIGVIQSQTTFVPIILFLIIVIASQMVATTIASEKENKSFEILLSSPLDRKVIVLAKILASGFMALVFAGFYMLGFGYYMNSVAGGALTQSSEIQEALVELGVVISPLGYLMIGASLFLAILIALVIAIILGTMAEDVKGVQAVTTPLMILILIPYFLTMFLDISAVSPVLQYLINAIPFSYPFLAIQKVILGQYAFIFFGLIYQAIFFGVFVFIASKVFTSDLILTWKFTSKKSIKK